MKRFPGTIVLLLCTFSMLPMGAAGGGSEPDIRPSVLAGTWYPGSQGRLEKGVGDLLESAGTSSLSGEIKALIVPHAGYRYSGGVAACGYKLIREASFSRVILLGPSHRFRFKGSSVNPVSAYRTPLGTVPVDKEFCRKLMASSTEIRRHGTAHQREHCLEIQLPFLQSVLGDFRIVPILMGDQDPVTCRKLADSIARALEDDEQETLVIASSDLSHFHPAGRAQRLDGLFMENLKFFDPGGLETCLASGKCEACGGGPVVTVLRLARQLGADRSEILAYSHSGKVTGDNSRVVGYVSAALFKSYDRGQHPR